MTYRGRWSVIISLVAITIAMFALMAKESGGCAQAAAGTCPAADSPTFAQGFTANEDEADSDSRIGGDTDANLTYWDAGNDRVGVGTSTPRTKFDVPTGTSTLDSVDIDGGYIDVDLLAIIGDISPAQITSDQNNYNPASLSTATILRLSTDATRTLTGLAGGADGRIITILNVGAQDLVLAGSSGSSTAANQFSFAGTYTIGPEGGLVLVYDSTSSRWRIGAAMGSGFQRFTGSGTWTKPSGIKGAHVVAIGAGGGGGNTAVGNGGGGGGSMVEAVFDAADLSATETITIGAGGAEATAGGNSTFGSKLTGYGGGGAVTGDTGAGGGGGSRGVGGNGATTSGGAGGAGTASGDGGAGGGTGVAGAASENGGGGGAGGQNSNANGLAGGVSTRGGGGGGSGGYSTGSVTGGDGGASSQNGGGAGGAGGAAGASGAAGTASTTGAGGGGGGGGADANPHSGGTGGAPGGGGGGGSRGSGGGSGGGGGGARGEIRIWWW